MERNTHMTLFLWLEGFFPKTVSYYLLVKGLVDSPAQMYEGHTNDPQLDIRVSTFTGSGFESSDPHNPKPPGRSSPCLRVIRETDGNKTTTWIQESSSILRYLEDIYPQAPRMASPMARPVPLERAAMNDYLAAVYKAFHGCNYYIKNAAAVTSTWSGIRNEDRSLPITIHAKQVMIKSFSRIQEWAAKPLRVTGWLTPDVVDGPGLVDVALAAGVRYMELSYSFHLLEEETLRPLRLWYTKFKALPWWEEYEEQGRHPKELSYPPDCRET